MIEQIYILSEPIRSGKTTHLLQWAVRQNSVGGILTPDTEDGLRKMLFISNDSFIDFEVLPAVDTEEVLIEVGRFRFFKTAFEIAQKTLLNDMTANFDWLIIDEIGKLELQGNGLAPTIEVVINYYKLNINPEAKLLLVIRDTLLEQAIKHYDLEKATILNLSYFK